MRIAILGPTASGKSALAVQVARRIGATVVNGDPFQAIRGLEIGTGQPSAAEQGEVPHLGFGVFAPSWRPNPASFGAAVRGWLDQAEPAVLVTGSGLYLRGIWEQLSALPAVPDPVVAKVRELSGKLGVPVLHRYLAAVDPARAAALHPNDRSRVQRALALHLATGGRPSALLDGVKEGIPEGWRALLVLPDRQAQQRRVAQRVAAQVAAGWPGEVRTLVQAGHRGDLEELRPLGYQEWLAGAPAERAIRSIVQATHAYAKRQSTFFRNQWPELPTWDPDSESLEIALGRLGL